MPGPKKVLRKTGTGTQYAALCFRRRKGGKCRILLVTSRGTGRWIPPKGWPIRGLSPAQSAAQEAFEEAGVKGAVGSRALGKYKYHRDPDGPARPSAEAYLFPLEVVALVSEFKEKGQRRVKWFSRKKAALMVREPKLRKMIRNFDPDKTPAD